MLKEITECFRRRSQEFWSRENLRHGEKCQSVSGEGRGGESKNIVLKTIVRSYKGQLCDCFLLIRLNNNISHQMLGSSDPAEISLNFIGQ